MQPEAPWKVVISARAKKALDKLPDDAAARIRAALRDLALGPFRRGLLNAKPLKGLTSYRLRVRSFRVIYDVDRGTRTLRVREIVDRKDAY